MNASPTSLEHYDHVSLYETSFKTRKEDVRFFCQRAKSSAGPVLEYGAGAGRITLPLARAGAHVTAVDLSEPMLERLRQRTERVPASVAKRITLRRGDMRTLRLKEEYPLIFGTFNVVAHMATYRDLGKFFSRVREHLAPGGEFIFDVPLPHPDELEADPEERFAAPRFKHPDTGEWIRQTERFEYDPARQTLLVESEFRTEGSDDSLVLPLVLRQWFPKELEAILHYEGFSQVDSFADYTQQPGLLAKDTIIFVARI